MKVVNCTKISFWYPILGFNSPPPQCAILTISRTVKIKAAFTLEANK